MQHLFLYKVELRHIRIDSQIIKKINFEKKSGVLCCAVVCELSWHTGLSYPRSCCRGCTGSERSSEPPPGHTRTQQPGTYCWSLWRQKRAAKSITAAQWSENMKHVKRWWGYTHWTPECYEIYSCLKGQFTTKSKVVLFVCCRVFKYVSLKELWPSYSR